jgi:hypothetical protein
VNKKFVSKLQRNRLCTLVIVAVAQRRRLCVDDVADGHIRSDTLHVDHRVHANFRAVHVLSVHTSCSDARGVGILPDAVVVVDEEVVKPEDGVAGRRVDVAHDTTDTVVAVGVGATFGARGHVLVGWVHGRVVARVDPVFVSVLGQGGVASALKAVRA